MSILINSVINKKSDSLKLIDINEFIKRDNESKNYEVIDETINCTKIFFKVNNISRQLLIEMVNSFIMIFDITTPSVMLINNHYDNYIIIFDYRITRQLLFNIMLLFNDLTQYKYAQYINYEIYNSDFIMPYITLDKTDEDKEAYKIIKGDIKTAILQYVHELKNFNLTALLPLLSDKKLTKYNNKQTSIIKDKGIIFHNYSVDKYIYYY